MCGICGKLDFHGNVIEKDLLKAMCRSLDHRGPDDEGFFVAPSIGLGHRRLSIIDLSSAGRQPMSNEDGSIWLVFNGEIYDFGELRKNLQSKGHIFKSQTDCEIILHLYEQEGISCLENINGMFAFALWDTRNKRLYLGRDRVGIKPLLYYWDGRRLVFASEIKAILCDPEVQRDIEWEALDLYLTLNYIPAPMTIFRNIKKLIPGHYLVAEKKGIAVESFWDIQEHQAPSESSSWEVPSPEDYKHHLHALLEDAVRRRLISDVPLGAFLSGGVDSSIIVALMSRNSRKRVKTFSIGYKDLPAFDETKYAREVARFNRTDHQEFKLGHKDILDVFPTVLDSLDEPFADSSAVPTFIVSRETGNAVKVALSGDGGDELFAGYRMYQAEYWSQYYAKIPSQIREAILAPLINMLPDARDKPGLEMVRRIKKFANGMSPSFPARFCGWREVFSFPMRQQLLKSSPEENLYLALVRERVEKEKYRFHGDTINLMLFMDVMGLLPGDMLNKVDRMSMANSLEVRVPFLDHTVAEYVFQLKGSLKLKGNKRKHILMETFRELLPPVLHRRSKWGFEMPLGAWLRNELKFLMEEYLAEDIIKRQDLFHYESLNSG